MGVGAYELVIIEIISLCLVGVIASLIGGIVLLARRSPQKG